MSGGPGDDTQNGGDGNDLIFANVGVDTTFRRRGQRHPLGAGQGSTSPSIGDPVGDSLDGGNGDDTFRTRDGEVDKITCGPGNDKAILDNYDVITDAGPGNPNGSCERVERRDIRAKGHGKWWKDAGNEDQSQYENNRDEKVKPENAHP